MVRWRGWGGVVALCVLAAAAAGCARFQRHPVPEPLVSHAMPEGLAYARFWGDEVPRDVVKFVQQHMPNVRRMAAGTSQEGGRPLVDYLALSGGADDGAFGAGLLVGWTKSGDRPQFEIVTGVSAGALIAPFAFLGPGYDPALTRLWTGIDADMVATPRLLAGLLGAEALADTAPLRTLISRHIDRRMIRRIAREYHSGRLLLVGTTNLDAQRQVIWNMGEIAVAASRSRKAEQLLRDVLLASASIPGVFPTVHIKVRAGGRPFEEMHVDGSTTRHVFLAPARFSLRTFDGFYASPPVRRVYVVRNAKLEPVYAPVEPNTLAISAKSLFTMTKSQSIGDLNHIYAMTRRDGAEFRLVSIPMSFTEKSTKPFDPVYMKALFKVGHRLGRAGNAWVRTPPQAVSTGRP